MEIICRCNIYRYKIYYLFNNKNAHIHIWKGAKIIFNIPKDNTKKDMSTQNSNKTLLRDQLKELTQSRLSSLSSSEPSL